MDDVPPISPEQRRALARELQHRARLARLSAELCRGCPAQTAERDGCPAPHCPLRAERSRLN